MRGAEVEHVRCQHCTSARKFGTKRETNPRINRSPIQKWEKAIWLGHTRDSNETIVGTAEGTYRAYAIKRMMESERWDPEFVKNLQGTPQQPDPRKKGLTVPISFRFEPKASEAQAEPTKDMAEPMVRRRVITQTELEKYGFTPGCPGCLAMQRGEVAKRGHSEACRKELKA